ncbi:hypothetical protein BDW72DRAFT_174022 [Aspergillus terricola var. indicus]
MICGRVVDGIHRDSIEGLNSTPRFTNRRMTAGPKTHGSLDRLSPDVNIRPAILQYHLHY